MLINSLETHPVVFAINTADSVPEPVLSELKKKASAERRSRSERFRKCEDACRSLVAEALIKFTLKSMGCQDSDEIIFKTNQYGKPVAGIEGIHFNVSHSGSWVVCAADNHEIGIDTEQIHKIDNGIAERFYAPAEIQLLSRCTSDSQWIDLFFQIWVLKESYIKAIGKGLSCSLSSFAVLPHRNDTAELILYDKSLPEKFFKIFNIDPAYKCAICCSEDKFPEKVNIIPVEKLAIS